MKKIAVLVTICLCAMALTLTACDSKRSAAINDGVVTVEGSQLTVALEGNITTGFDWTDSLEGTNLKLTDNSYQSSGKNPVAAGGGGVRSFVYKAEGTGTSTITFTYARSWESEPPMRTIVMKVDVKGGRVTQIENSGSSTGIIQFIQ